MRRLFHQLKDPDLSRLWVVLVVSNPVRYISRYDLLNKVLAQYGDANVLVVEQAFGDRHFEVTEDGNPRHLRFRSYDELWIKEAMINKGIEHLNTLDPCWEYVCWVDADVLFQRPDFLIETWHELQHHMFVQMFQTAIDLGPHGEALETWNGFAWNYVRGEPILSRTTKAYEVSHTGFAWGARREAIDFCGGLIDMAILGASDHHMAMGLIGRIRESYPSNVTETYKFMINLWEERCERYIKRDIGFVKGTLLHLWHGRKRKRFYKERWNILTKHQFCPFRDIRRDSQGLWVLNEEKHRLRDAIREYMRSRDEDEVTND